MIKFTVFGNPKSKGSMTAYPFKRKDGRLGANISQPKKSEDWETLVKHEAMVHNKDGLLEGSLWMRLEFYFVKPKSRIRVHSDPYPYPNVKPDLSKLVRSVEDALTGIVYKDDAQIVSLQATKFYDAVPRVEIAVGVMEI